METKRGGKGRIRYWKREKIVCDFIFDLLLSIHYCTEEEGSKERYVAIVSSEIMALWGAEAEREENVSALFKILYRMENHLFLCLFLFLP